MRNSIELAAFTNRFAALIESGASLARCLRTLEASAGPDSPYADAARQVREAVEAGQSLSHAMAEAPMAFSTTYVHLVRAGEQARALDVGLRSVAGYLVLEERSVRALAPPEPRLYLIGPNAAQDIPHWESMPPYLRGLALVIFFETFALLLDCGVPILKTLDTMAGMMPSPLAESIREGKADVQAGLRLPDKLAATGLIPAYALELMGVGEENGTLDFTLRKAAELIQQELEWSIASGNRSR